MIGLQRRPNCRREAPFGPLKGSGDVAPPHISYVRPRKGLCRPVGERQERGPHCRIAEHEGREGKEQPDQDPGSGPGRLPPGSPVVEDDPDDHQQDEQDGALFRQQGQTESTSGQAPCPAPAALSCEEQGQ